MGVGAATNQTTVDRFDLSGIDARWNEAGDQAFVFIGQAGFTVGQSGRVRVVDQGATLVIQADCNGDAAADFELVTNDFGIAKLTGADFIL